MLNQIFTNLEAFKNLGINLRYIKTLKPFTIFIVSSLLGIVAISFSGKYISLILFFSFWAGFFEILFFLKLYRLVHQKYIENVWLKVAFGPKPTLSIAFLGFIIASLGTLLYIGSFHKWNASQYLSGISAFIAGVSFSIMFAEKIFVPSKISLNHSIKVNRYEFFSAALLCSILSAIHFQVMFPQKPWFEIGMALIPLMFALMSLIVTWFGAYFLEKYAHQFDIPLRVVVHLITTLVLMSSADILVNSLIPEYIMSQGREYSSRVVLRTMQVGILIGLFAGFITLFYSKISKWYIDYLVSSQSRSFIINFVLRLFINGLIGCLPFALVVYGVLYGYQTLNLYGISLILISMLSHGSISGLLIETDELKFEKLTFLTGGQRLKISKISPTFRQVIRRIRHKSLSF
ncbi:MAG: hypothetical protein NZM38_02425 [Cytophagales bacterium]|nr:hypothetical protein [Cytophagales bacterium]MDW8383608.1 hypothetical protein [Flammeovirgaceae bacterium]